MAAQVRPAGVAPLKRGQGAGGGRGAPKPPGEQAASARAMPTAGAGPSSPRSGGGGGGRDDLDPDAPPVSSPHHLHLPTSPASHCGRSCPALLKQLRQAPA